MLLTLDGIAVLIWFVQALLLPDYPAIRTPGLAVSFIAEFGLAVWLLVNGVKAEDAESGRPRGSSRSGLEYAAAPAASDWNAR